MELVTPATMPPVQPAIQASGPSAAAPAAAARPALPDTAQLRGPVFGALERATFVIPPHSLVVTVPGMFGPKASVEPLAEYLGKQGHNAHSVLVPGIGTAQLSRHSVDWLTSRIDNIRTGVAQENVDVLSRILKGKDAARQKETLRRFFGLDESRLADAVLEAIADVLTDPDGRFMQDVRALNPQAGFAHMLPKAPHERLSRILKRTRTELCERLSPAFHQQSASVADNEAALNKTVNKILDTLAPRVYLVGHSLGGFISTKALMDDVDDVAMTLALGSPVAGTEEVPPSLAWIEKAILPPFRPMYRKAVRKVLGFYFPAIEQMNATSKSVQKLQNTGLPYDTTAVSVANPLDGLVTPRNARLNDGLPGKLNLTVTPLEAQIEDLVGAWEQFILQLAKLNPFVSIPGKVLGQTEAAKGFSHHCGLVQNHDAYWPCDGDMLNEVFESDEAVSRIRTLLHPQNTEAVRERVLELLADRLEDKPELARHYRPLRADLESLTHQRLPFADGVAARAEALLQQL